MRFQPRHASRLLSLAGIALATVLSSASAYAQTYGAWIAMSGLNNPRRLAVGPDGGLYVTEAGTGGNVGSIVDGAGETVSYGATGSVSRLLNGVQSRVLTGLPSLAPQGGDTPGGGATGLHDIIFSGGQAFGVIGLGGDPALRTSLTNQGAPGANFGQLVRLSLDGSNTVTNIADISAYEAANNPGRISPGVPDDVNSNPYALAEAIGGGFVVADAGANALLRVNGSTVSLIATFDGVVNPLPFGPPRYQAVPTSVTVGSDNAYYVSQLTGFPFPAGAANIFRVVEGQSPTIFATGFTNLIDVAMGPDGFLYALELTTNGLASQTGPGGGRLTRISLADGSKTVIFSDPLFFPGGMAFGSNGTIYVTDLSTNAGTGRVLALTTSPEPGALALLALVAIPAGIALRRRRA